MPTAFFRSINKRSRCPDFTAIRKRITLSLTKPACCVDKLVLALPNKNILHHWRHESEILTFREWAFMRFMGSREK
jgi:hypothetical protein